MSKKMLKRSLALGALMAFVITGSAMASGVIFDNIEGIDTPVSGENNDSRYTAHNVNGNVDGDILIKIQKNYYSSDTTAKRVYGIAVVSNECSVSGDTDITAKAINLGQNYAAGNSVRAVRVLGPDKKITFNGLTIDAYGENSGHVIGIDSWAGNVIVNENANIKVVSKNGGQYAIGLQNCASNASGDQISYSETTFNGASTTIYVEGINDGAQAIALDKYYEFDNAGTVTFNSDNTIITVKSNKSAIGVGGTASEKKVVFEKGNVTLDVTNTGTSGTVNATGIASSLVVKEAVDNFTINVTGSGIDNGNYFDGGDGTSALLAFGNEMDIAAQNLNITVKASESTDIADRSDTHGIIAIDGGRVNVTSKNINITVNDSVGEGYGVLAGWNVGAGDGKKGNGNITLGGDESIVTVKVTAKDATGIMARGQNGNSTEGSSITVNGSLLDIDVDSTGGECAAGIFVSNGTESVNGNGGLTKVIVNSETTTIDAVGNEAEGIATMSEGSLFVNSNITVNSETNAIYTRGNAKTYINFDEDGNTIANRTTVLNGDIAFGYDEDTSGTPIDADVKVNLDGEGSSWTGDTTMYNGSSQITGIVMQGDGSVVGDNNTNDFKVSKFTLNVSNGAKWTTDGNSFVNTLNLDEGVVEMNGTTEQKVLVGTTIGEGTVVISNSNAQMVINDGTNAVITAATKVEGIDNMTDEEIAEALKETQGKVVNNDAGNTEAASYAAHYGDSALYDEVKIAMTDLQGEDAAAALDKTIASTNVDISDMAALGMMSWRAEMNDMNKRMGELRNANGEHGVWVRMVRGEDEYNNVKTQYNQYQLGYDEKLSVDKRWTVGMALSYTDGETSFAKGSGENTNKALSIYGSKLNNDGTFVDLIAKYARLENEFIAYDAMKDAEYSTNGYSVSAEFGKRIQQGKGLWIEPQVELSYGKVSAVDYLSKAGVKVAQDSMESLVGRVGFSLGKDISKGNVYARASYLYDFDGETSVTLNGKETLEQDLGGGWWEVGVGANINLSKATYIYADVEKTFGGEVDTNWQWNLGVRYSF